MKKLYSCFLLALVAMVSSFSAKADITVTLKIDDATRLNGYYQYQDPTTYSYEQVYFTTEQLEAFAAEGGSTFTIPASSGYVYVLATDGNTITSAKNETSGSNGYISGGTQTYFYLYGSDATLSVTSADLESTRTASCTVTVDDASKVSLSYYTGTKITLVNGENTVKFNPNGETPFMLSAANYGDVLYSVKLNDAAVADSYGRYSISAADGDKVSIEANFPDAPSVITFSYGDNEADLLGCVSVTLDGVAVEDFDGKTLNAKLGQKVKIIGDTNLFNFNSSIKVDGSSKSFYGSYEFTAVNSEYAIDLSSTTKYATFDVTLTVDTPDNITVYVGSSSTAETLVEGDNTLTLSDAANYIYVNANSGCYITSIKVNDTEYSSSYGTNNPVRGLAADAKIVVVSGKVVRDYKATVWVDDIDAAAYGHQFYGSYDRSSITLVTGENEIVFGDVDNPFYAAFYVDAEEFSVSLWQNGVQLAPQYEGATSYRNVNLVDGDYWKVYLATVPESFAVTFDVEDNTVTDLTVGGKAYEDYATGFTALKDTEIVITAGTNCRVYVNGVKAAATDGKYVIAVTAETEISVKAPAANVFAYDLYSEWTPTEEGTTEEDEATGDETEATPAAEDDTVVDEDDPEPDWDDTPVADAGTLTVHYSLNTDATSVWVAVRNAAGEAVAVDLNGGTTKGSHSVSLPIHGNLPAGTYTWDVEVSGEARDAVTEFASLKFYHPNGLDVDNSFESPSFGTLFVAEGYTAGKTSGYVSAQADGTDGSGLYMFDPTGEQILSEAGNARFYGKGLTHSHTLYGVDGEGKEATSTSGGDFSRVAVADDGRIFVSRHNTEGNYLMVAPSLDELVKDGEFTTSLVEGMTMTDTKVYNDAEGNFLVGPMQAFDVKGGGEDTKIIALTRASNLISAGTSPNRVVEYSLGTGVALTVAEPFAALDGKYTISYDKSANVAYDCRGGVWYIQFRYTPDDTNPALVYVDADGKEQYFEGVGGNVRQRAGIAVSPDATMLVAASANGVFSVYDITYAEDGKVTLTEKYAVSHGMGGNLYSLAIDCAGNVYGGSATKEFVKGFALPHTANSSVVTKAASKYAFEIEAATSAIEEVRYDNNAACDNNVYNLQGMLLIKNATEAEINALPAGLYIINGKKVIRK